MCLRHQIFLLVAFCGGSPLAFADLITLSSATTTVTGGTATAQGGFNNGPHTFHNGVETLTTVSGGGTSFDAAFGFNRVDGTLLAGASESRMYYFNGGTPLAGTNRSYSGEYATTLDDVFDTPFRINVGHDNTLATTYESLRMWSGNELTIETAAGLNDAGVGIVERGANDDDFRVRLITSLDAAGNPDGYSAYYEVNAGDPFGTGLTLNGSNANRQYDIYSDFISPYDGEWLTSHQVNAAQRIGAFLITFDEFGLGVGDSFYGYEIARLNTGVSGIDLIPGGGVFTSNGGISGTPEPSSLTLLCSMLALGVCRRRKRATVVDRLG